MSSFNADVQNELGWFESPWFNKTIHISFSMCRYVLLKDFAVSLMSSCFWNMIVNVKWGKEKFDAVELNTEEPPMVFKAQLFALTGVQPERQKVMVKGGTLKVLDVNRT